MRGETKVCLYDANTGEQVFEHVEHNMVTNAVSKILSPRNDWLYGHSRNILGSLSNGLPVYARMLGGVLLFNNTLPENENQVLPTSAVRQVGYAGGEYGGSNQFRGSYNTNESGPVTNGFRHVWDFGTDKGNGAIRSVCLTSIAGGNTGWCLPEQSDTSVAALSAPASFLNPSSVWEVKPAHGRTLFVRHNGDSGMLETISYYSGALYISRETSIDSLKATSLLNIDSTRNLSTSLLGPVIGASQGYPERRLYYMGGKIHHVYAKENSSVSSTIVHHIYNLDGALESSKEIITSVSFYGYQSPMFYFKEKYYTCATNVGDKLNVFNADGSLDTTILYDGVPKPYTTTTLLEFSGVYVPELDKMMLVNTSNSSAPGYSYLLDSTHLLDSILMNKPSNYSVSPVPSDESISPYIYLTRAGSSITDYSALYIGFWTPYLGTINNLESAVTKTSAHTMKIVYTIYND